MLDKEKESWVMSRLELRHSHPCSAKKAVHYHEYKELTMHAKCVITDNNEAGIRPNKTYLALANKEINPNFFYAIDVDDANKFRSTLWVDARCRASYEYYGDVVSFDTTYIRNRHGLPFASFVGVNHHGKSTLLGCALLGSEETDLYANQRKWVPIFFKSEFWASMWSTQRSESMHVFYGGFLHCKSGLVQFVNEYDNVLGNNEQKELEDDVADLKGVIPCIGSTCIEREFQQKYTSNMFRILQLEGDSISVKVDEQKVFWEKAVYHTFTVEFDPLGQKVRCECNKFESPGILCCHTFAVWSYYRVGTVPSCYVLPRWSKNVIRKHTYIKSIHDVARTDESHNLFRRLCSEFYNVAQEFVACDEEAAILWSALWDAKSKMTDYRASMRSTTFAATQNTIPHRAQAVLLYMTYRDPQELRLKDGRRDVVDLHTDNDHDGSVTKRFEDSTTWNASDGCGFMSLLNSFRHR
ncbi:protein FAR1-RELATED SEQUENCE 6-like [Arachis ipaensis]|uniref:protein FAR1-RELATED SEQUENCE 6-like n=1 Tax=Arachis ipaensis TaxID=130454 RepID=UPI0007AF870C|nr:protein FAR1-RELATED SEQUENCE 6-like [Arachis ipaensis]